MDTDREKINRLYQSEDVSNQLIAIGMLGLIGETAANFIWEDIFSKINKDEAIKKRRTGLFWANYLTFIDITIIGGRLQVYDNSVCVVAHLPNNFRIPLIYEGNIGTDILYDKTIKKLKEYVFEHTNLFTDIETETK